MTTLLLPAQSSEFDAGAVAALLGAHGIPTDRVPEGWTVEVTGVDLTVELGLAGVHAEEMLCRSIIDQGRVDGRWPAIYRPAAGSSIPPLFSVVIPTHDRPELLPVSVKSACAQLVTSIEVLVVDDGGTTPVAGFADPRVRVIRLPDQRGPAAARNAALAVATGRFVAFLDDDDLWLPERLDLALQGLRDAPVSVCWTQHLGRPGRGQRTVDGDVSRTILDSTTPCLGATALRRDLTPRFDEAYRGVEDVVWWWTVAQRATVRTVPRVGYLVRLHDGMRGANTLAVRVAENLELLRHRHDVVATPAARAHRWLRVGLLATESGDLRTALSAFARHVRLRPRWRAAAHVAAAFVRLSRRRRSAGAARSAGQPLRVLSVVGTDRPRGAERAAQFLADALTGHDVTTRIVAARAGRAGEPRLPVAAVLVPPRGGRLLRAIAAWRGLRRELRTFLPDVILAHGAEAALLAGLVPRGRRRPPVVWQRILQLPTWPRWHLHTLRLRLTARRVDAVVAITDGTHEETRRLGFRGPVWRLPNHRPAAEFAGTDTARARDSVRAELGLPPDAPLVGFVGHLVAQKNPADAVRILDHVMVDHPDARLLLVGDGPLRAAVDSAVDAAGLNDRVTMLGHRHDVPRLLAAFDVLTVTSTTDSMPGVVLEAQLTGTPVVSYPVDGIEQALDSGRTGVVTGRADPREAAAHVAAILSDTARRQAMTAATRSHGATHTTAHVAERYARMLRALATTRRRPIARVLHVLPDLGVGGAEQGLRVLAEQLEATDIQQYACVVSGARVPLLQTVHAELQAAGVPLCDLGVRHRPTTSALALLQAALRLRRLARRVDATVVSTALLDASLPARLSRRRPLVTHLVNTPWAREVDKARGGRTWRTTLLRLVDRWSSRRDDQLVALTHTVAAAARRDLGVHAADERLVVVPRGVDLARFAPGPAPVSTDIVSVGRLVPQKGHDVLVAAVARLRDQGVPATLRLAGEGPLAEELQRIGGEAVDLLGPVHDVAGLLRGATVFALATRWEGQSNAVLEAMATGLPVVVSDIPVMREVVGDAGVLVSGDADAWAEMLRRLLADPHERERLGVAARARAVAWYDARPCAARIGGIYLRLSRNG